MTWFLWYIITFLGGRAVTHIIMGMANPLFRWRKLERSYYFLHALICLSTAVWAGYLITRGAS